MNLRKDIIHLCFSDTGRKVLINVEDAPFIATYVEIMGEGKELNLKFNTNVDDTIVASKDYPIRVVINKKTNEPSPYILIRRNLEAKISRSVFYELIEIAEHFNDKFGVWSGDLFLFQFKGCYY